MSSQDEQEESAAPAAAVADIEFTPLDVSASATHNIPHDPPPDDEGDENTMI